MYNVIKIKIDKKLDNQEMIIGSGNYIILQYAPIPVYVRINENTAPLIMLKENSGFEYNKVNRLFLTCEAVASGELIFLQGDTSSNFRYIPPQKLSDKISVSTVDEIKSFSKDAVLMANVRDKYEYKGVDVGATIDFYYLITNVFQYTIDNDKIVFNITRRPEIRTEDIKYDDPSFGQKNEVREDGESNYLEILLDGMPIYTYRASYEGSSYNMLPFTLENCKGKTLTINVLNARAFYQDYQEPYGIEIENGNSYFWTIQKYDLIDE